MRASVIAKELKSCTSSPKAEEWPPKHLSPVLNRCLRRVNSWPPPPNWSWHDWTQVIDQVANIALWDAIRVHPANADIPLEAFAHQRIMSALRTKARQEYRYHFRSTPLTSQMEQALPAAPTATPGIAGANGHTALSQAIHDSLASLPAPSAALLREIFCEGRTVTELSRRLQINRRTLNSQKVSALGLLRCTLCARDQQYTRHCTLTGTCDCSRSIRTGLCRNSQK